MPISALRRLEKLNKDITSQERILDYKTLTMTDMTDPFERMMIEMMADQIVIPACEEPDSPKIPRRTKIASTSEKSPVRKLLTNIAVECYKRADMLNPARHMRDHMKISIAA